MEVAEQIRPNQRYTVWGSSIEYNGFLYSPSDEFTGVQGVTAYYGAGFASEIIGFSDAQIEVFRTDDTFVFPDRLQLSDAALGIESYDTNIIFPEQLNLHGAALEVQGLVSKGEVKIIYSRN
ncbi:MAG: hypothetical protein LBV41_04810 [Cytophagaceae bacterium]|jgi:hypothetical protein|nr:hypothetical protein [Cytophagaceae bacterium]